MSRSALAGLAASLACFGMAGTTPAHAVGLCGCCIEQPVEACAAACAAAPKAAGQCLALVVHGGTGEVGGTGNPLNGFSFKDLDLGNPSAAQAEKLRRFLEKHRRRAARSYTAAAKLYQRGKLGREAMDKAKALLDEANVNYQHGIRAYLNRIGRKSD